ncbi:uncharacterized protein G2W53_015911 [Senna tora]|uniref:Transposase (putative) gypsy type domain-containing protein n=1 Tax=Senna tora TaxID=362788 RepID=A0A834WX73_9FABA|nr:uncharacterized protein G2W53_015911 [Senna tora]
MPPFTDFEIALLNHVGCAPSMMMPNSWILVGGFEALCNFHKVKATVEAFFYFFQMNFPHKGSWFYFQARGRGPHAKKLFQDLKDPPKDWKKYFFLVRPRPGCRPAWWLREDGTPLFSVKWVEPFEAVPRTVLRTSSADTQNTVRVLSAFPSGLDVDDYFVTDETGGKFNPARVLSLVKREEAKHGNVRSADRSGSSTAHQTVPRGGSKDGDSKKSHGKDHSGHSRSKGKVPASSGSKTSGSAGYKRSHERDTRFRSPSLKRMRTLTPASGPGAKGVSEPSSQGAPVAVVSKPGAFHPATKTSKEREISAPADSFSVKLCEESLQKEKAFLAAEKELVQLRLKMASLRSSEQLLKVQLENAQNELNVWKERSSAQGEEIKALRQARSYLDETQMRFFNPQTNLELRHINLHHELEEENVVDIATRAVLWKGPFDASQELSPDDMMDGTPSEVLVLESSALSLSVPTTEEAVAEESLLEIGTQVIERAEDKETYSVSEVMGLREAVEGPPAESLIGEPGAMELKPAASGEEFANSILAD